MASTEPSTEIKAPVAPAEEAPAEAATPVQAATPKTEIEPQAVRTEGETCTGTVKRYSVRNGYGFVAVDGGGDVFLHQSEITTDGFRCVEEGQRVEFEYKLKNGKPNATKLRGIGGAPLKKFETRLNAMQETGEAQPPATTGGVKRGKIKFFNVTKGFGFITADDPTCTVDVFVHVKDCPGNQALSSETVVLYSEIIATDGKRTAKNIMLETPPSHYGHGGFAPPYGGYPPGPPRYEPYQQYPPAYPPAPYQPYGGPAYGGGYGAPPAGPAGSCSGTVKFYNVEKGFGFIIPAEGGELYLGKSNIDPGMEHSLTQGAAVTYEKMTKNDKVWAVNVRPAAAGGAAPPAADPAQRGQKRAAEWDQYPAASAKRGYAPPSYPPAQAYPPAYSQTAQEQPAAYPPQQAAYPPQQAAYPPQQAAYPPQQAAAGYDYYGNAPAH